MKKRSIINKDEKSGVLSEKGGKIQEKKSKEWKKATLDKEQDNRMFTLFVFLTVDEKVSISVIKTEYEALLVTVWIYGQMKENEMEIKLYQTQIKTTTQEVWWKQYEQLKMYER